MKSVDYYKESFIQYLNSESGHKYCNNNENNADVRYHRFIRGIFHEYNYYFYNDDCYLTSDFTSELTKLDKLVSKYNANLPYKGAVRFAYMIDDELAAGNLLDNADGTRSYKKNKIILLHPVCYRDYWLQIQILLRQTALMLMKHNENTIGGIESHEAVEISSWMLMHDLNKEEHFRELAYLLTFVLIIKNGVVFCNGQEIKEPEQRIQNVFTEAHGYAKEIKDNLGLLDCLPDQQEIEHIAQDKARILLFVEKEMYELNTRKKFDVAQWINEKFKD